MGFILGLCQFMKALSRQAIKPPFYVSLVLFFVAGCKRQVIIGQDMLQIVMIRLNLA
jgi:hypothetical protein